MQQSLAFKCSGLILTLLWKLQVRSKYWLHKFYFILHILTSRLFEIVQTEEENSVNCNFKKSYIILYFSIFFIFYIFHIR